MILEECPVTKVFNEYWNEKILNNFPILENAVNSKFLSLKKYITENPQKFYNKQIYHDFLSFLTRFKNDNPNQFVDVYKKSEHELNIAIKSLNEINNLKIHDLLEPNDDIEKIRFIENNIHFNYLKLTEAVYHKFIFIIAYRNRLQRKTSIEGLNIFNCVEEIKETEFDYITTCYDNTIRNGIAHGCVIYKEKDTVYKGKRGKAHKIATREVIRMFDDLLDICNGFSLALKIFFVLNRDFFEKKKLIVPRQFFIQELKAQADAPKWKVVDCLENVIRHDQKQLNIFTENSLLDYQEVFYYALRTAILAEYFACGYDRYFFSLKSKYSLLGWAAYNGEILKRERLKDSNDINGYKGVLEEDLLFFVPKIKIPRPFLKILRFFAILKINFPIEYHKHTNYFFKRKYKLRDAVPFRRGLAIIINDPSLYIIKGSSEEIVSLVRKDFKKIISYAVKKSKNELNSKISRLLPTSYIKLTIYDTDLRKRQLRGSGLIDSLVCSITVNKSRKIKDIDFIGGKPEVYGRYRIVWNENWKGIDYV